MGDDVFGDRGHFGGGGMEHPLRLAAIVFAIVFGWLSGAAVDTNESGRHANTGALVFLVLAGICGYWAWKL